MRSCKELVNQWEYLANIPTQSVPGILRLVLTPALLQTMIHACLYQSVIAQDASRPADFLEALLATERFGISKLGIPAAKKKELASLWTVAAGLDVSGRLIKIRKAFWEVST